MNSDVMKVVYAALFGVSGPIAGWLLTKGIQSDQVPALLNAIQVILTALTPTLATAFLGMMQTLKAKLAAAKKLPDEAKSEVASTLPDDKKIAVAASVPEVTQVVVSNTATDGVAKAALDPMQPKVMTVADAKAA